MNKKKPILILIAIIALCTIIFGYLGWKTSPKRTLDGFFAAIKAGNQEQANTFVSEDIKASKSNNINWFLEDWVDAEKLTYTYEKEESWNSRVKTDENGNALLNEHGFEDKEKKATPKYWAHHYHTFVSVEFEDFEDPVIVKLKRESTNSWSPFAQLFKGWKVTRVYYQPLTEEDLLDFGLGEEDEYLDFGNGEDVEFEVDEEGNLVPVIIDEDTTEETESEEEKVSEDTDAF